MAVMVVNELLISQQIHFHLSIVQHNKQMTHQASVSYSFDFSLKLVIKMMLFLKCHMILQHLENVNSCWHYLKRQKQSVCFRRLKKLQQVSLSRVGISSKYIAGKT